MLIRVPKSIHPPEAKEIAASFRRSASEVRNLAVQVQAIGNQLNATWEGKSKVRFMGDFSPEPGNLNSYADYLENCARKIESIEVIIWEEKELKG